MLEGSKATAIDPVAALLNASAWPEALHMLLASYAATGFAVAGVHAFLLRRDRANPFHRRALAIALAVGGAAAVLQPISGDWIARVVARNQPVKLAAMEGQFRTRRGAPLRIGGLPDPEARRTRYALEIPAGLSLLAYHDPDAEVLGLDDVPRDEWPPVPVVHLAFQVMVGCGTAMMAVALWAGWAAWRSRRVPDGPAFLAAVVLASPLGAVAVEAGWTVTEVGRQPWIIRGVMRTADAVTPVPGLWVSMLGYSALYLVLGIVVVMLLLLQFRSSPRADELTSIAGGRTVIRDHPGGGRRRRHAGLADRLRPLRRGRLRRGRVGPAGPRAPRRRPARADRARDRAGLGGEPRLADHRGRAAVHRLPVGVRRDHDRAARPALADAGRRRAPRLRLHVPRLRQHRGRQDGGGTAPSRSPAWRRPILLGTIIGAVASGRIASHPGGAVPLFSSWLRPFPLTVGLFALAIFAYLAAVYLTLETDDPDLRDDFRLRALNAAVVVGVLAYAVYLLARRDAPLVFRGLDGPAMGVARPPGDRRVRGRGPRGPLATMVPPGEDRGDGPGGPDPLGMRLAQWPYLVPPDLTASNSAAPPIVHKLLLGALVAGSLVLLPSIYYMLRVFKGHTFAARRAGRGRGRHAGP